MGVILDSRVICSSLEKEIRDKIGSAAKLCLASLAVGEDYSTGIYRSSQQRLAQNLGIEYKAVDLPADVCFEKFKVEIGRVNKDKKVTGIIINKPLPWGWRDADVFSLIDYRKDVEGMHPINLGKFLIGDPLLSPPAAGVLCISPTVRSVIALLDMSRIELYGKRVTIVGFSSLIGKQLALFLGNEFATVSITHIATYDSGDLPSYVMSADVLISAVGKPHLIRGSWIKEGAVVIDVGTGEKNGKLTGDIEFDAAKERASFITPVPGGVGKLTTMFLYYNLVTAAGL